MENNTVEVFVRPGEEGIHIATELTRPNTSRRPASILQTIREWLLFQVPGDPDEPSPVLIVKALTELVKRYKITQYKGGRLRVDSLLIASTMSLSREIKGPSLYPVKFWPKPRVATMVQLKFEPPAWMIDYYKHFDEAFKANATWVRENSFVSGNDPGGVYKTLLKFVRERLVLTVDPHTAVVAFLRLHLMLGWHEDCLLPPKTYDLTELLQQSVAYDKSGGFMPVLNHQDVYHPRDGERFVVQYTANLKKQDAKIPAALNLVRTYRRAKIEVELHDYQQACFQPHLYLIKFKQQAMPPGTPPDKVRIFAIPPAGKVLDDSYRMAPFFKACVGRAGIMVGFSWSHGGAQNLAEDMHAFEPGWSYMESDFSGLDHSLKAGCIALLSFQHMFYYNNASSTLYKAMRAMALDSAQQSAVSYIDWQDEEYCRLLIGMILSGEFATSNVDSMYVRLFYLAFDEHMQICFDAGQDVEYKYGDKYYVVPFSQVTEEERAVFQSYRSLKYDSDRKVISWGTPIRVYGDDTLAAFPTCLEKYFFDYYARDGEPMRKYPVYLAYYLDKYWDVQLKYSDTHIYSYDPVSNPNPFFTEVKYDKVVKRGPRFLQRHFVNYKIPNRGECVMPWRPTEVYYSKLGCRPADLTDDAVTLAVCRGLKLDTMGTNVTAYAFLDGAERIIMSKNRDVEERLPQVMKDYHLSDMFKGLLYAGVTSEEMCYTSMTRAQILKLYMPDDMTPRKREPEVITLQ